MSNVASSNAVRLSDAQLVMLSAASQRKDALVVLSEPTAASRTVAALIRRGLLAEVPVARRQPSWREDANGPVGLQITKAGFAALGLDKEPPAVVQTPPSGPLRSTVEVRAGTKQAAVVELLAREQGATLREVAAAMGWLPHTTRAALTGLRRRGYAVASSTMASGERSYRIAQAAA
ncbi:DUF3489 domain-containing protein [Methylopila sp. 73B]|uniref:DUF3489 domain-containing protein n=1 Tax=Methylopila sp. 73B TaxID=1120792 RepID=UPI00036A75D5|nr:DUF3489 domain-containing protein [Methylopila sp. 73B]